MPDRFTSSERGLLRSRYPEIVVNVNDEPSLVEAANADHFRTDGRNVLRHKPLGIEDERTKHPCPKCRAGSRRSYPLVPNYRQAIRDAS